MANQSMRRRIRAILIAAPGLTLAEIHRQLPDGDLDKLLDTLRRFPREFRASRGEPVYWFAEAGSPVSRSDIPNRSELDQAGREWVGRRRARRASRPVFRASRGVAYHATQVCDLPDRVVFAEIPLSLGEAEAAGLRPCQQCFRLAASGRVPGFIHARSRWNVG